MIEFLRNWVVNVVTVVIVIVLMELLIPSGKLKKTITLVSGLILMIAIMNPIARLIKSPVSVKDYQLSASSFLDKKQIENSSKILREKQLKQMAELYRQKLIANIEANAGEVKGVAGVKADVLINEDYESDSFGEVKRVYLSLSLDGGKNEVKPVTRVERIEVNPGGKKAGTGSEDAEINPEIRRQIEEKISKSLNVHKDNIVLSLQAR